ncbi:MAG: RhuM family protein [Anaerorhabdus sp.]|uniref:RhuM family protein n=1 Tax=Anaerorhabdus sp. TaxID=1872524 RepID=UPI002FCC60AF
MTSEPIKCSILIERTCARYTGFLFFIIILGNSAFLLIKNRHRKNNERRETNNSEAVTEESSVTAQDGKKYNIKVYNLQVIISVGYRINSIKGVKFRQWVTKILKEYTLKRVVYNNKIKDLL